IVVHRSVFVLRLSHSHNTHPLICDLDLLRSGIACFNQKHTEANRKTKSTYRHKHPVHPRHPWFKMLDYRNWAFYRVGYRLSRFGERPARGAKALSSFRGTEGQHQSHLAPEVLWRGSSSVRITIHLSQHPVLKKIGRASCRERG